jgi:hypothetical protein
MDIGHIDHFVFTVARSDTTCVFFSRVRVKGVVRLESTDTPGSTDVMGAGFQVFMAERYAKWQSKIDCVG